MLSVCTAAAAAEEEEAEADGVFLFDGGDDGDDCVPELPVGSAEEREAVALMEAFLLVDACRTKTN